MFSAGYGGGKTRGGAEKALDLVAANPGVAGLVVSPTYQMLTRTTMRALDEVIPSKIVVKRAADREWRFVNGARIYFGSADKPGSLEGTNVGWVWIDEGRLVSAEAWRTIVGRNRDRAAKWSQIFVTTTPAMGWLHSEFAVDQPGLRERIVGTTRENAHNLAPGFVEELERTFSHRQARALIDGEFTLASGAVFDEWNTDRCLIDWHVQPHARTVLGIDFGVRKPAVILAQILSFDWATPSGVIPAGTIIIADEFHVDETPTVRLVDRIRDRWPGLTFDAIYVDPAGNARDQNSGMPSVYTLESAFGKVVRWSTEPDERWIPNGIALLQGAIAPSTGAPRVRVARVLADPKTRSKRGVVAVMEGARYPEKQTGSSPDHPVKDGELDHACIDGATMVSTPMGWRPIRDIRQGDQVWARDVDGFAIETVEDAALTGHRECLAIQWDGGEIICTADHPILTVSGMMPAGDLTIGTALEASHEGPGGGGFVLPDVRRLSVSEGQGQLLSAVGPDVDRLPRRVPASGRLDRCERTDGEGDASPSQEREPRRQQPRELGVGDGQAARGMSFDAGAIGGDGRSHGGRGGPCGAGVARDAGGARMAQGTCAKGLGRTDPNTDGLRSVRLDVRDASRGPQQVLSPELQDGRAAGSSEDGAPACCGGASDGHENVPCLRRHLHRDGVSPCGRVLGPMPSRVAVTGIRRVPARDVWNLTVSRLHNFVAGGVVVSNCDALRYLVQGILRDEGRVPANVRLLRGYAGSQR